MAGQIKVLLAEDELMTSATYKQLLQRKGYQVITAQNGISALKLMEQVQFDILLTDWMMPLMDGIELIRRVRESIKPIPYIIMFTAIDSQGTKDFALNAGADDYFPKPVDFNDLEKAIKKGLGKMKQTAPSSSSITVDTSSDVKPDFVGVTIASSTGGPKSLIEVFKNIPADLPAAFYLVQHAPDWMISGFAKHLQENTPYKVNVAMNGHISLPKNIYIAPGGKHLNILPKSQKLAFDDAPEENFSKPSADPLFRSGAQAFGKYSIGVVLTGLGKDGANGCSNIEAAGGAVIIQDPESAVAPSMPEAAIKATNKHEIVPLAEIGKAITHRIKILHDKLKKA